LQNGGKTVDVLCQEVGVSPYTVLGDGSLEPISNPLHFRSSVEINALCMGQGAGISSTVHFTEVGDPPSSINLDNYAILPDIEVGSEIARISCTDPNDDDVIISILDEESIFELEDGVVILKKDLPESGIYIREMFRCVDETGLLLQRNITFSIRRPPVITGFGMSVCLIGRGKSKPFVLSNGLLISGHLIFIILQIGDIVTIQFPISLFFSARPMFVRFLAKFYNL
jgi:hypothetical protein